MRLSWVCDEPYELFTDSVSLMVARVISECVK